MRLSPYFEMLAREKRICPECLKRYLTVEPAGRSPNVAMDCCECGYRHVVSAPSWAHLDYDPAAGDPLQQLVDDLNAGRMRCTPRPAAQVVEREGNVLKVDFTRRSQN